MIPIYTYTITKVSFMQIALFNVTKHPVKYKDKNAGNVQNAIFMLLQTTLRKSVTKEDPLKTPL